MKITERFSRRVFVVLPELISFLVVYWACLHNDSSDFLYDFLKIRQ